MNDTTPIMQPEGSKGSLIGSVIVVLILIIGAVYLYFNRGTAVTPDTESTVPTTTSETMTPPDDVSSLEMEASSTDTSSLDADMTTLGNDFAQ